VDIDRVVGLLMSLGRHRRISSNGKLYLPVTRGEARSYYYNVAGYAARCARKVRMMRTEYQMRRPRSSFGIIRDLRRWRAIG
jgi:predicted deacetylase